MLAAHSMLIFNRFGGDSAAILQSVLRFPSARFTAIGIRCDCDYAIWASISIV